jgi:hypothetical protein
MHAFDDTGYVASFTPQAQLSPVILNLQDIRRQVENLPHPVCLMQLHQDAISYMNAVVTSLVSFMAGVDRTQLTSNVSATQKMRQVYEQELANVLGLPYATPTPVPTQAAPANTPAANMPALENTPAPTQGISGELPQVQNASTLAVNIRSAPDMVSAQIGVMAPGDGAQLLGRNEAGDWLLIATPNGQGWVFTRLVKVNVVLDTYPVITATPKP